MYPVSHGHLNKVSPWCPACFACFHDICLSGGPLLPNGGTTQGRQNSSSTRRSHHSPRRFMGCRKDIPKPQGLIGGCRNDSRSIGTLFHIQDTGGMTLEFLNLGHGGIVPQD